MSRYATPLFCPFCGEEDLRPVEDDAAAWSCRACAHVFSVNLVRVDHGAIPANRAAGGGCVVTTTTVEELAAEGAAAVGEEDTGAGPDAYEQRVETARKALRWAAETFGADLTVASSMGDEVLVHLVGTTIPGTDVFFLDTGYHFAETLGTRDAYAAMLPIRMRTVLPLQTVAEQDAEYGPKLHDRDPDRCCAMRKVEPLERALSDRRAWVTGMRREDAPTRTDIAVVGVDERRGMVKVNPIAGWTADDVARYTEEHGVFENPLRQIGFASIGCAPCTRAVADGEDPRAGRWSGRAKTECGLHT